MLSLCKHTHINPIAGILRLFASALRPTLAHCMLETVSPVSSKSESRETCLSRDLHPPTNATSLTMKSSTSKAPEPDFIARAFWAPILEAIRRKCESKVASWGPFTAETLRLVHEYDEIRTFIKESICLMNLLCQLLSCIVVGICLLFCGYR